MEYMRLCSGHCDLTLGASVPIYIFHMGPLLRNCAWEIILGQY